MERNIAIDFGKFFAIFFVVFVHTLPFLEINMDLYVIIDSFARFAVPFFFMASGYLCGKKIETTKNSFLYVKKYCLKNLKLLMSWTVVYFFFDMILKVIEAMIGGNAISQAVVKYFKEYSNIKILYYGTETGSFHLWFLIALLWSISILYAFVRINKVTALLIISVVLNMIGLFGQSYSVFIELPIQSRDPLFFGLIYTTIGYYFSLNENRLRGNINVWFFLSILFLLIQPLEALFITQKNVANLGDYYLSTLPLSICLFVLALKMKGNVRSTFFTKVGKESVGIYVIHPLWIRVSSNLIILAGAENLMKNIVADLLYAPLIFLISYFSYNMIQVVKRKFKKIIVQKRYEALTLE